MVDSPYLMYKYNIEIYVCMYVYICIYIYINYMAKTGINKLI